MFSLIAILEYFLLLEALKDSKIPYLFLTDLVSVEFHLSQKKCVAILFFVIKMASTELLLKNIFSSFKRNLG